jgi:hypothetical protein
MEAESNSSLHSVSLCDAIVRDCHEYSGESRDKSIKPSDRNRNLNIRQTPLSSLDVGAKCSDCCSKGVVDGVEGIRILRRRD